MTGNIFKDWFHRSFVPEVEQFLTKKGLPVKAILLIDNAPSHPPEDELKSENGFIFVMFMPLNVTPLIQPIDQNAIRITKLLYRNSLLASIAAKGGGLIETMKQTTLKEAIIILESAWRKVGSAVLSKCWNNILNMVVDQDDPEDEIPLSFVRENLLINLRELEESAANILCALLPEVEYTASNVKEWNKDAIECEDNAVENISDEDDCVEEPKRTIKPGEAVDIFNKALDWAEGEMVEQRVLNVLRDLRDKAALKVLEQKKRQKKITDFFEH